MVWTVRFAPELAAEFTRVPSAVQIELLAQAGVIEQFGPHAGRPRVDRLKGSKFANMKELRFDADGGVWRVAWTVRFTLDFAAEFSRSPLTSGERRSCWRLETNRALP